MTGITRQEARELLREIRGEARAETGFLKGDLEGDQVAPAPSKKLSTLSQVLRHFDGLDGYHGAGALIMMAGSIGMIVSSSLLQGSLGVGFLAGVLPTFLILALVHPENA